MARIGLVSLLVPDYDEAIDFFVSKLGFELVEDTRIDDRKRWVVVRPAGASETGILLAKAASETQIARVGDQTGGRVFLFLHVEDFAAFASRLSAAGIDFVEGPRRESYGMVGVFKDIYGNKWDLIERPA